MTLNVQTPYFDKVRKLPAEARFVRYIVKRYQVRARRLIGAPRSAWTDDPILHTYKFTNVKREWDYTSTWLMNRWYRPNHGHELIGLLCATARFICLVDSLQHIPMPTSSMKHRSTKARAKDFLERAEKVLLGRQDAGHKVFTSAYMIGGVARGERKVSWVVWEYLWPAWESGHLSTKWSSLDTAHRALNTLNGWGHFMTQEVVLDIGETWLGYEAFDRHRYAYAGPGAIRGLQRVFPTLNDLRVTGSMSQDDAAHQMQQLHERATARERPWWNQLPDELHLTRHDIEFNLCEFDKYERLLWGEGVPKQRFHGPQEEAWAKLSTSPTER